MKRMAANGVRNMQEASRWVDVMGNESDMRIGLGTRHANEPVRRLRTPVQTPAPTPAAPVKLVAAPSANRHRGGPHGITRQGPSTPKARKAFAEELVKPRPSSLPSLSGLGMAAALLAACASIEDTPP